MKAEQILQEAKQMEDRIAAERRTLHRNAETAFDLENTVAFVRAELTEMGYEPMDCGRAGIVALAGGKKPGKVFLLRADMDGLPIREETGL
ncbi:MAG: amidohydrolase, partial [Oscillospiraceae bacterium]|nr:amidohydrolase [Oscillospiraceae bacterium]